MFIGAVPKEVISQVLATVPFDDWGDVYVGCSGSFRFDRAVKMRHPGCRVYSNDVSLLTCSIGALAKAREFDIRFKGALEFVEAAIAGLDFRGRVAAVMVAWVVTVLHQAGEQPASWRSARSAPFADRRI